MRAPMRKSIPVYKNKAIERGLNEAEKTAKSYMSFKSGYGLMIADLTDGTLDPDEVASGIRNILIGTEEIKIRNGQANLARFGSSVYLDEAGGGVYVGKHAENFYNARILSDGMKVYDYETQIANFGSTIWLGNASNFSVDSSGKLTANSATISGKITATSGKIGGWDILSSRIERDLTGSSGKRSGIQATDTYSASAAVFYAGCNTAAGGAIADPSHTNWFVRQDGTMYGKTAYLGYTGADENQYVYVNNTGLTAYVMSSGSGTLQAVSVATLRGSVTYPSGIEKPTGTLNLGGAYISGTYARDEGLYKFTTNATFATLRADVLNVGGNKPITMRIIKKTNQSIDAAPSSGYVGTGKAFVFNANTPSGYRLVGCTVVYTNHAAACKIGAFYTDAEADTITVYLVNQATSAFTDLQINVRALYFAEGASSVMAEATG